MNDPKLRLGVNIDHIATLRNARGGTHPDPVAGAWAAIQAGADGITAHLREDRRHISDDDLARLQLLCSSENVPSLQKMARVCLCLSKQRENKSKPPRELLLKLLSFIQVPMHMH